MVQNLKVFIANVMLQMENPKPDLLWQAGHC